MRKSLTAWPLVLALFSGLALADRTSSPEGANAYIISPADGQTVGQTVAIQFGLENMGVAPAGVERSKTGHHHLLIDVEELPPMDRPLPASDNIIHFGGGQTQVTVRLEPGKHTLQLVLGDHTHTPHYPSVKSKKITINVRPDPVAEKDTDAEKSGLPKLF